MNEAGEQAVREREARRLLFIKKAVEVLAWLAAAALFAFASHAVFAASASA